MSERRYHCDRDPGPLTVAAAHHILDTHPHEIGVHCVPRMAAVAFLFEISDDQ